MDDGDVAAINGVGVHGLELGRRLHDEFAGQLGRLVQIGAALHLGLYAVGHLGRVDDIGAAHKDVAHHAVDGAARLRGKDLGGLNDVVVDGGQLQRVGDGGPAAVLLHLCRHGGDVQVLAVGGHALGQRRGRLGQTVVLAELDGLAAVGRDGVLIAELVVHQCRFRLIQQPLLVVGLHLGAHAGCGRGVLQLCAGLCEHLQIQLHGLVLHVFPPENILFL